MKVITLDHVLEKKQDVHCPEGGFVSYRYLLEKDGMGFALMKTMIPHGEQRHWHYTKHQEACFCVSGYGILTNIDTGMVYEIKPDTCYALDNHDDHLFQAITDVVLISVFNPPLKGNEVHKEDGSYE